MLHLLPQTLLRLLLCSSKNRRYIWLQLWEADIIFRSHLIQAPFDGWSLFGEILDIAIKEISDLSKLPKSPGRERRKASTSKPRFFYYYFFKDTKPHAESFHSFCCWKRGYFSAVATLKKEETLGNLKTSVLFSLMLKPFFCEDATCIKFAFLNLTPNQREKETEIS